LGSGVEKILVFPDEVSQNHVFDLVIFFGNCAQPRVGFVSWFRFWQFFFVLGLSSPGLPLPSF
jgi:hypothetical protein